MKHRKLVQIINQRLRLFEMCSSWGQQMHTEAEATCSMQHIWTHLHPATSQLNKRVNVEKHFLTSHGFHLNHKPQDEAEWARAHLKENEFLQSNSGDSPLWINLQVL